MTTMTAEQLRQQVSGSSFYAGMRVLPRPEREAMYAIYGFCRIVDDIADDLGAPLAERRAELDAWRGDIAALYCGEPAGRAEFLLEPVRLFGLAQSDFVAVIDGMQMDLDRDLRWPVFAELDLYCDRVASAVGRLSCPVFGMERETGIELSHHLGRALQFTNILRDIDEDAAGSTCRRRRSIGRGSFRRPPKPSSPTPVSTPPPAGWPPRRSSISLRLMQSSRISPRAI
jgi:presqualene diphosphate synthase